MNDPEQEVLAQIGRLVMQSAAGRPELARAIFKATVPHFAGRYPHHKILSHLCDEAAQVSEAPALPAAD